MQVQWTQNGDFEKKKTKSFQNPFFTFKNILHLLFSCLKKNIAVADRVLPRGGGGKALADTSVKNASFFLLTCSKFVIFLKTFEFQKKIFFFFARIVHCKTILNYPSTTSQLKFLFTLCFIKKKCFRKAAKRYFLNGVLLRGKVLFCAI